MEIDINNYESILIDYFDGNLNALEVAEVLLFLEQHPEIKNEFEAFGTLPEVENISIDQDFKSNLKKLQENKSLSEKSFNALIIAQMEGDIDVKENEILNGLIAGNQSLITLKNTFLQTKLKPELEIVYLHKQALKRKEAVVFYLTRKFAAAAAILLLASLMFLVYNKANRNIDRVELAANKNKFTPQIEVKESLKNTAITKEKAIALVLPENKKQNKFASKKVNASNNDPLVEIVLASQKNELNMIPVKPLTNIENQLASASAYIKGEVIAVQIPVNKSNAVSEEFLTINSWIKTKLIERGKNNLIENERPIETENLAIEPFTIASIGADILQKTTGTKVSLTRSFNKAGSVKSYAFAAGNFKFERIK